MNAIVRSRNMKGVMARCIVVAAMLSVGSFPAAAEVIYVSAAANGSANGSSWANAKTDLAAAVTDARTGDDVWVAAGTYGPIELRSGVRIIGGFAGTESATSESDPVANRTIISGGGTSRCVTGVNNDASAVLRGFSIRSGFIAMPNSGAGMFLKNSNATIIQCEFVNNKSEVLGGGVANWIGSPTFVGCTFHDNDGGLGGGAVANRRLGKPSFVNCLFYRNKGMEGGAVAAFDGDPTFTNCTFADNTASVKSGGAIFDNQGRAKFRNCILWGNVAIDSDTQAIYNNPTADRNSSLVQCAVQDGWPGPGNIPSDPLFVNAAAGDYRLQAGSPCRDAGDSSHLPKDLGDLDWDGKTDATLPKDLGMNPRVVGAAVNMGAYE